MKFLLTLFLTLTTVACTYTIYGVSPQRWEDMTETERQHIREEFKQQEEILEKTRIQAEAAKQEAEKLEQLCREEPEKCEKTKRQ